MKQLLWIWLLLYGVSYMTYGQDVAYALRQEALRDFDQGKAVIAQQKLISAYDLFVEAEDWEMASMCLYERAIDYMNVEDLNNMAVQCEELKSLYEQHYSAIVAYNYHSVASAYYSYVDSIELAIQHGWGAIHGLEQIEDPYSYDIIPVWSYYNMAFFYDAYMEQPQVDSVRHYLGLAREVIKESRTYVDSIEALISVVDMEAWQEYYEQNYMNAELMMHEVLMMIDTIAQESPNTIITERGEAYKFLAMLYEEQEKWEKALEFQKKVIENNELRYDVDKRLVLQEVQTKYEVEKQQLEMGKLAAENKSRGWLVMALGLLVLLLVIGYWLLIMRKKNAEAKLYEAALEADNMRQAITNLEAQTDIEPLRLLLDGLIQQLHESPTRVYTQQAIHSLQKLDLVHIQGLLNHGVKITTMDKRYILCFAAGMSVEDIADFMCLEPASVYTVRYRLRKKFGSEYPFPY